MNDIYSYSDYRVFLKDFYDRQKAGRSRYSYRTMAESAGINSSPYFKFVIEGKRNLSKATIMKTVKALELDEREAEYFENLVFFNQAKTAEEKNIHFDRLISSRKAREFPLIKKDQLEYFREWHHCVVRELAVMADFGDDFARLGKLVHPPITAAEAEASVDLLLELGLLTKAEGRYKQAEPILTTGHGVSDYQVIRYQIRMMQLAAEAFERSRAGERMTSSSTMGVSLVTFERVVRKIRDFRAHLMEMVNQDAHPEKVFQLNMSLFPLSRLVGDE
ncbi:MAG: hypothetical protein JWP91_4217 [Fibrobacteres bacterium]|nr:hypothetical protein [Fibrobacterota bacterium]